MKYFIKRYSFIFGGDLINEMTSKTAMEMYKQQAGSGFLNLRAIPNFLKGKKIYQPFYNFWGEEITEAECFRRKLKGTLLDGIWSEGND